MMAGGNAENVKKEKGTLLWASIGLVIIKLRISNLIVDNILADF